MPSKTRTAFKEALQPAAAPFLAGLLARVLLPFYCHGFRWDDEHWQVIEPANHLIHGVWSITTEWREGLRSWIYPWLVSLPMRAAEALGVRDALGISVAARIAHGLMASVSIIIIYSAVMAMAGPRSKRWAVAAAWMTALWPFAIYCGFHTQGEMTGALFVLLGVAAPALISRESLAYSVSGVAFGVALMLKIDVAVAGLGYGLWQLLHLRIRRAFWLAIGAAPLAALIGLVDRLTWGTWFHSVLGHAHANLVEGVGNQWGVSPWYQHIIYYFDINGVPGLLAAILAIPLWRNLPPLLRATWFTNAFFVAVYAAIPHKEKRFLAPLLYTGILASFATLAVWQARMQRMARTTKWQRPLAALVLLLFCAHFASNVVVYLARRPWYDRIAAIHAAGRIPGIEKMLSPQWPAVFYFPRHVPSEAVEGTPEAIARATAGLHVIAVATDWVDLSLFTRLGFKCIEASPPTEAMPRALKCSR